MRWFSTLTHKSSRTQNLGMRLGYGAHERLLIVHADDLGIAHAVNAAFISGLATGLINSGSVIVPGGSLAEIAAFARAHPDADIGLHLALTSDSPEAPWASVASPAQVASLVDANGNLLERWKPEAPVNAPRLRSSCERK